MSLVTKAVNNYTHYILESDVKETDQKLTDAEYLLNLGKKTAMVVLSGKTTSGDFSECEKIFPVTLVNLGTVQEVS